MKSLEDSAADVTYVPVMIPYASRMPKRRWEVMPGMAFMPISRKLKKIFDRPQYAKFTGIVGRGSRHVIRIEKDAYLPHAKKRLAIFTEGQSSDFYPPRIAKNLILSLALEFPNGNYVVGGDFSGREPEGEFICSGYGSNQAGRRARHEELAFWRVTPGEARLNRKSVSLNFRQLEPYFLAPMTGNTVFIKSDPIAVAAQGIWAALSTAHDDQAFITFAMVLESLLTTATTEVTLQIAERAAILLEKSTEKRLEVCRAVKRLYGLRSSLVHGSAIKKKPKHKANVHPTFNFVDRDSLQELGLIAIRVLWAVLRDKELYGLLQEKGQPGVDAFYVGKLFS